METTVAPGWLTSERTVLAVTKESLLVTGRMLEGGEIRTWHPIDTSADVKLKSKSLIFAAVPHLFPSSGSDKPRTGAAKC